MKNVLFVTLMTVTTLFTSCSKEADSPAPVADFTYEGNNTFAPASVKFKSTSLNAGAFTWDFGDNTTGTGTNPSHTYAAGGTYTVKLTAQGDHGLTNSITKTVNVANAAKSVTIDKITLGALTGAPAGNFTGYVTIRSADASLYLWTSGTFNNMNKGSFPTALQFGAPYIVTNLTKGYVIEYWQSGVSTRLGFSVFVPSLYMSGADAYTKTITLPDSGGGSVVQYAVTWQ